MHSDKSRIVGAFVCYTHRPFGEMFAVRQGRTHIGAGNIRGEDRQVDVHIAEDVLVSSDHALVLNQADRFYIEDLGSVNGTYLNGKRLRPERLEELPSHSEIQVGETFLTFVSFVKPTWQTSNTSKG
jgi:pSer/pThr/pTyr-binding forkhead associated (FHA) protein